jgi:hypothetical protein
MKNGNKVGIVASILLAVAAGLVFLPYDASPFETASLLLQGLAILLLVYAGVRGSRWWLLVPVGLIALWIWALSRGH